MSGILEARELAELSQRKAQARQALRLAILRAAAEGLTQKAIAERCGTSTSTVRVMLGRKR